MDRIPALTLLGFGTSSHGPAQANTVTQLIDNSTTDLGPITRTVEQLAQELLARHSHFHGRAGVFEYECHGDVLIIRGSVPSFYLKQVLQTVLKDVEGVACIDNRVDVISSEGASRVS